MVFLQTDLSSAIDSSVSLIEAAKAIDGDKYEFKAWVDRATTSVIGRADTRHIMQWVEDNNLTSNFCRAPRWMSPSS